MTFSIIYWNDLSQQNAPDSTRLLFITKNGHWVIGTWDSDHDFYSDDNAQPIFDIILWAYIPDAPYTGYKSQGFYTNEALDKFARKAKHNPKP